MTINTDGNLYALRKYEKEQDNADAYERAIESKAFDIQETLLANKEFKSHNGIGYDLVDLYADFELENDTLADFLNENSTYGTGQYLRNKMAKALEEYCYELAKDEVDNEEPPCDCDI